MEIIISKEEALYQEGEAHRMHEEIKEEDMRRGFCDWGPHMYEVPF